MLKKFSTILITTAMIVGCSGSKDNVSSSQLSSIKIGQVNAEYDLLKLYLNSDVTEFDQQSEVSTMVAYGSYEVQVELYRDGELFAASTMGSCQPIEVNVFKPETAVKIKICKVNGEEIEVDDREGNLNIDIEVIEPAVPLLKLGDKITCEGWDHALTWSRSDHIEANGNQYGAFSLESTGESLDAMTSLLVEVNALDITIFGLNQVNPVLTLIYNEGYSSVSHGQYWEQSPAGEDISQDFESCTITSGE